MKMRESIRSELWIPYRKNHSKKMSATVIIAAAGGLIGEAVGKAYRRGRRRRYNLMN